MLSKFSETKGFALSSAHFTQADTIIPNPGNSGDWDRYAYVLNNPINFNDPSGHAYNGKAIKAEKLFSDMTSSGNKNDLINDIKTNFGWTVGVGLSDAQVLNIWTAGLEIAAFIMKIDPTINPFEWIQNYLGNAVFYSSILQDVGITNASLVYPRSTIWLSDGVSSVGNIVHELGHVLDNNLGTEAGLATFTGGSIADGLLSFLGITPEGRRWENKHKTKDTTYWFY